MPLLRRIFRSINAVFVNIGDAGEPGDGVHRLDGSLGKNSHPFLMHSRLFRQTICLFHQLSDLLIVRTLQHGDIIERLLDAVQIVSGCHDPIIAHRRESALARVGCAAIPNHASSKVSLAFAATARSMVTSRIPVTRAKAVR